MRPATLFKEYIWLINTIHRHQRLTFEEINQHWVKTEMSGGLPMARSSFNRHRGMNKSLCNKSKIVPFVKR